MTIHPVANVIVVDHSSLVVLPDKITANDAAILPAVALVSWLALVENTGVTDQSIVLLHDAGSCMPISFIFFLSIINFI